MPSGLVIVVLAAPNVAGHSPRRSWPVRPSAQTGCGAPTANQPSDTTPGPDPHRRPRGTPATAEPRRPGSPAPSSPAPWSWPAAPRPRPTAARPRRWRRRTVPARRSSSPTAEGWWSPCSSRGGADHIEQVCSAGLDHGGRPDHKVDYRESAGELEDARLEGEAIGETLG